MFEVNTFSNLNPFKSPSYEHLLMRIAAGKATLLLLKVVFLNRTVYLVYISISKIRCSRYVVFLNHTVYPFPKRGVPQSCILYLYIEDMMFEVNTFSNFKSILKRRSYEHLLMRIAASKLPFLPKRGVPQSHCISSVYLYIEDTMIEVNIFSDFKSILKVPSYSSKQASSDSIALYI
ncbi:hypothetical protein CEXT_170821 [Caerostris extrusa]|uniref:Uncharacterized protein n=1 Tax=Caerostris extrusa TaxID=172846 RepID=A0AAV4XWL4_CAEEX|nr:hypothetical protein CEXT_170821 [Caerostris extrusa]